jgi:CRISPR-associated protein Csc2
MEVRAGDPQKATTAHRAVDLFYRKQPGAERRMAKSIQRDLLADREACVDDYMDPNEMNQNSVESVLFGSAAGDQNISQRSRVYYNSAYSLRSASACVQQNTQTAAGDELRERASEGQGTWTPDFVKPGTLFPSVVTLDSATPEEVMFVLATLARTTRYGKSTSRGGNVNNHLLGVWTGRADGPANLELARLTVGLLATARADDEDSYTEADLDRLLTGEPLAPETVTETVSTAYEELLSRRGLTFDAVQREELLSVVESLQDDETLAGILERQAEKTETYVDEFED